MASHCLLLIFMHLCCRKRIGAKLAIAIAIAECRLRCGEDTYLPIQLRGTAVLRKASGTITLRKVHIHVHAFE